MEPNNPSTPEQKPFSVLERFRQLKKEKEQSPLTTVETVIAPQTPGTVFQASSSSTSPSNGEFGKGDGPRSSRGWQRGGKRNFNENFADKVYKPSSTELHQGQKEQDVGITEYVRDGPGFDVILKHRFTDFHVNEIDTDGQIVKLTSLEIPKDDMGSETLSEEEDPSIMSPEQWVALREIADKELSTTIDVDVTDSDKEHRQRIHKAVKRRFGARMYSNTKEVDNKKFIEIGHASGQPNHRFCSWPRGRPEYLHFVMFKANIDMSEAINVVARLTFIKPNKFGYAGTKDKRGVTTQQMCVRRGEVERLHNCSTKMRGITIGNYSYKWNSLRLGDLSGNRFKIALRHVKASDTVVREAVEQFEKTGFINYFGMQRFGQSALVPTYSMGKAILKGDWKLAVELILKPRPGEVSYRDLKEAREVWWNSRDANKALKCLTRRDKSIEGKVLMGLKKHGPNAYQNAFDNLPKHTVTMYLHSYQSLIWNKVVSRRIREFGLKVLPGDLVKVHACTGDDQEPKSQENASGSDDDESGEVEEEGEERDCESRIQVRALSAEEAENASIYDIFYPLPGDDIRFPDNEVAKWYTELLEQDGHSMECFRKINKKYGMYGSYRHILERAQDLKWWTLRYTNPDDNLLQSDLDVLQGKPPPTLDPEGPYKAVILEFNLKVCCYATMAVRELAKCETSTSSQAMLTNQAREEDQASKKLKLEQEEKEQEQKMEENENKNSNCNTEDQGKDNCEMETDPVSVRKGFVTPPQNVNADGSDDEEREMNKREAEADNIINKYLERQYMSVP